MIHDTVSCNDDGCKHKRFNCIKSKPKFLKNRENFKISTNTCICGKINQITNQVTIKHFQNVQHDFLNYRKFSTRFSNFLILKICEIIENFTWRKFNLIRFMHVQRCSELILQIIKTSISLNLNSFEIFENFLVMSHTDFWKSLFFGEFSSNRSVSPN